MNGIRHECYSNPRSHSLRMALTVAVVTLACGLLFQGASFADHELAEGYYTLVDDSDNEIFKPQLSFFQATCSSVKTIALMK